MKLTEDNVRKARRQFAASGKSERIIYDEDIGGFGLRMRGKSATFVYSFRLAGKDGRVKIGDTDAISTDMARNGWKDQQTGAEIKGAKHLYAMVVQGQNPSLLVQKLKAVPAVADTFGAVARKYLSWQTSRPRKNGIRGLKPRSVEEIERHLFTHCKAFLALPMADINRRQVALRLSEITEASGPRAGNSVRASLVALFNWSAKQGFVEANPAAFTLKNEQHDRDRVLTNDELRMIWNALPAQGDDFADICRLLMLTGQRRKEIGELRWSEIVDDGTAIQLPGMRTKNSNPHRVALTPSARAILAARPRIAGRDLVFGRGVGGFSGWSHCKRRVDAALNNAGGAPIPHWTVHDFRRTADTGMNEIGVAPHIVELVLNHTLTGHRSGVAKVYNQAKLEGPKAEALMCWHDHLMSIVTGKPTNVVPMRA